jgi:hypothetical protein
MKRRTLLKLLSLLPFAGPVITKAIAKAGCKPRPVYRPYLPAGFPKWNKAIDGLEDAGRWMLDVQRSLLPQDFMFPSAGQIWEAVRDCETRFRPLFSQPGPQPDAEGFPKGAPAMVVTHPSHLFLSALIGGKAQIRQGERIRILEIADAKPLHVAFQPLHYHELHHGIVPEDIRGMPGYLGYKLSVKTAKTVADFGKEACQTYFNEAFRLVGGHGVEHHSIL